MLELFKKSCERKDSSDDSTREYAHTLTLLHGDETSSPAFQHFLDFRMERYAALLEEGRSIWEDSPADIEGGINFTDVYVTNILNSYLRKFLKLVQEDRVKVEAVFPKSTSVWHVMLKVLFEDYIKPYVECMLENSQQELRTFLRSLVSAFTFVSNILKDVESLDTPEAIKTLSGSVLSQQRSKYLDSEVTCLDDLCNSELASSRSSIDTTPLAEGLGNPEDWSLLSFATMDRLISYSKESLLRCLKISEPGALAFNVQRLYMRFLQHTGREYIHSAVMEALEELKSSGDEESPCIHFYAEVFMSNTLVQLLQEHYDEDVLPHLQLSVTVKNEVEYARTKVWKELESKVQEGLECLLRCCVHRLDSLLEHYQSKTDFKLTEKMGQNLKEEPTLACRTACNYMNSQLDYISTALDGNNLISFRSEMGILFSSVLHHHLRRNPVTRIGSRQIRFDIQTYLKVLHSFEIPSFSRIEETLQFTGEIYRVPLENLRMFIHEYPMQTISQTDILMLVRARSDIKEPEGQRLEKMLTVGTKSS